MAAPLLSILIANLTGSWRYAFIFMSVPILLIGVLVWFLARDQERANIQASAGESDRYAFSKLCASWVSWWPSPCSPSCWSPV